MLCYKIPVAPLCRVAFLLAAVVAAGMNLPVFGQSTPAAPAVRDLYTDTWVATDALGRATPTFGAGAPAPRKDRYVGIFYFLTQGSEEYYKDAKAAQKDYSTYGDDPRVLRDNTQIIKQVGGDPVTKPEGWKDPGVYWWGEPAVGYFLADDPWVARKNLRMLADAGVDVIIFDVTNGPEYWNTLHTLLGTAEEMRAEGVATPQFAFVTHASSGVVANQLYDHIYGKRLYKNLWFYWQGKPLIFGDPAGSTPDSTPARPEVRTFFTWRDSWANTKGPNANGKDEWEWADSGDPQLFGWHSDPKKPEEMPVMVGAWANADIGRSYQGGGLTPWGVKGEEPPLNRYDVAAGVDKGLFFAQEWKNALKIDPEFLWVTGWNEWTAGRQYGPGVPMLGHVTKTGQYYFVDEYNEEFSRDAMPMKGGFGDDYYMQLVDGIRRFKGARQRPSRTAFTRCAPATSQPGSRYSLNTAMRSETQPIATGTGGAACTTRTIRGGTTSWKPKSPVTQRTSISTPAPRSRSPLRPARTGCSF